MKDKTNRERLEELTSDWTETIDGTEWTEPEQGATWADLWRELPRHDMDFAPARHVVNKAHREQATDKRPFPQNWYEATNLRLTGAPLTAEDIKRIAEAK